MQLTWKYHRLYLRSNDGQETVVAAETHNEVSHQIQDFIHIIFR